MDDEHHIAIYNIENPDNPKLISYGKGCRDVILDLKFSPKNDKIILATKREIYVTWI